MKNIFYRQKKLKKGLTAIELMVALVIIGVLVSIFVSNFVMSSKKRAMEATLVSNVRTLQIMLETYRIDWQFYPENLSELGVVATQKNYNKSASNPYTKQSGPVGSTNIWAIDFVDPTSPGFNADFTRGRVAYQKVSTTKYYLLAYDASGMPLQRKGTTYIVTNGEKN